MKYIERKTHDGGTEIVVFQTEALEKPATLAENLAEKWAMVACMPDGEDSSGKQKFRMLSPDEIAKRACEISDALWNEFEKRGWIIELPAPKIVDKS